MPQQQDKTITAKNKIYFIYFIIFTVIILIIFAFIIVGTFWDYWQSINEMETYYKEKAQQVAQKKPQINRYDPIKGQVGDVTIYEYSDFLCPACQTLQNDLQSLEKFYGNQIRFVFKGIPITVNPETRPSLIAAYCAWEQNQFWEYKNLLYQNPQLLNLQKYREYANQLNLNMDVFNKCLEDEKYNTVFDNNLLEAISLQISSVPTLYINDQKVEGFINYNTVQAIIESELRK